MFYVAYDFSDPLLEHAANRDLFELLFHNNIGEQYQCNINGLVMVEANSTKKPVWAQNDAMLRAYADNNEYYYRVNDDTEMVTLNWTAKFIEVLLSFTPPNVGLVGPSFKLGNVGILTYEFVHASHIDIFGYYYPKKFEGWHADQWITAVYSTRRKKLKDIWVKHTESVGRRYPTHSVGTAATVKSSKEVLKR
jgi:hypothetical protein